ncbi:MAG: glutathione synthase [Sporolactobacillus sp.]
MSDLKGMAAPFLPVHGRFGLERENLRVTADGALAMTPHPEAFGSKLMNPRITTDFSESQLELITPISSSLEALLEQLDVETRTVYNGLSADEWLWPLSSLPKTLPADEAIPIADFGPFGKDKTDYRHYLAKKYGRRRQLYCGIHLNFSFDKEDLNRFLPSQDEQNTFYLKLAANLMRCRFFLVHLLAASPAHSGGNHYRSIRLGAEGYRNKKIIYPDYSTVEGYLASIHDAVKQGLLEGPRELYQHIRIKGPGFDDLGDEVQANRIELRIPDLNPFYYGGLNPADLRLMHLYLLWAAMQTEELPFDRQAQQAADRLSDLGALTQVPSSFAGKMESMFQQLDRFIRDYSLPDAFAAALAEARERWLHPEKSYAARIEACYQEKGELSAALGWAQQAKIHFSGTLNDWPR